MKSFPAPFTRNSAAYHKALPLIITSAIMAYSLKHGPQPLLPQIAETFSLSPARASLVVASEMMGMSVMLLIVIVASEFMDRKKITGFSLLAAGALALAQAASPSFGLIVGLRFAQGMLLGTFPALMVSYINEEFDSGLTGQMIGIYLGSTAAGGLLGRFLTTLLSGFTGWRTAFVLLGTAGVLTAVVYLLFLPVRGESRPPARFGSIRRTVLPLLSDMRLLLLDGIGFILMGTFAAIYTYITFVLLSPPYNFSRVQLAPIFFLQICGTVSSTLSGKFCDRFGNSRVLTVSLLIMLAGSLITLPISVFLKCAGLAVFIAGMFAAHTAATSWISRLPGINKASTTSTYMLFYYIGGGLLSVAGGILYHSSGWHGVIAMIASASVLSLVLVRLLLSCGTQCRDTSR